MEKPLLSVFLAGLAAAAAWGQQNPPTTLPQPFRGITTTSSDPLVQENFAVNNRLIRLTRQGAIDPEVQEQFVVIELIARLPADQQEAAMTRLYRTLMTPTLMHPNVERGLHALPGKLLVQDRSYLNSNDDLTAAYGAELDEAAKTMTAEQVAEKIAAVHTSAIVQVAARRRAMHTLGLHRGAAGRLITEEFTSDDDTQIRHALAVTSAMQMKEFLPQTVNLLIGGGPNAQFAARAMDWIRGDPAAARPILADLAKNPGSIKRYQSLLKTMLSGTPPDPVLLQLLESPDADIRDGAALALEFTDGISPMELIPRLMSDADERVRVTGLTIAFRQPPDSFPAVRPLVIASLKARGVRERARAAYGLGQRNDPAGARVLLECAKDSELPADLRPYVSSSIRRLMNAALEPFWFMPNRWGPGDPQNARIIARFEAWVAENVKN